MLRNTKLVKKKQQQCTYQGNCQLQDLSMLRAPCFEKSLNQPDYSGHLSLEIGLMDLEDFLALISEKSVQYRKFPKYSETRNIACYLKIWTMWHYHRVASSKDADWMANSADPR